MPRLSPIHYIAPSAISIVPNANGSYNDIAVYVTRGAKIKVFSPRAGIDMSDNAYQEWNFSGRNRRLADSTVPYTVYARLDRKNRADGYLIFAPQKLVENEWVDKYPSVTQNGLTKKFYERTTAITKYWFVRLGEVSLPENGQRILTFDTGILDTDDFNTNWSLSPDALPLRVELGCTISDEDAGPTPYIYWGQLLVLSSNLVEGWTGTDIERFDHWEITRNTDDAVADAAWNTGERARTIRDTGVISLRHLRTVDDFNGAVSAIFTITAMERHENPEDPSNPIYAPLVSASINIHAETVEKYELVPSTTIVSYNPQSGAYNPADGVFVRVRATDQSGYVCELTNGQLVNSRITVQYAVADTENWIDVTFGDVPTDTAVGNIPTSAFSAQKNVTIRILGIDASKLTSLPISFVRDGEDSKEREWIFFRSVNPVVFVDEPGLHQKPALVNGGEVNPTGTATGEDTNKNQDGWVPENWWDEMQGTDEEHPYEYGSYRDFVRDDNNGNHWGSFSDPKIWSRYAGDAVTYDIVPSVSIINADAAGTIISDGIIVRAYKTKGKERSGNILPPTVGSNYFAEYSIDGGAWTRCAMFDYQPEGEQAVHVYGIAPEYVEQAGVNIALRLKSSDDVSEVLKEVSPIEVVRIVSEEETQAIVEQYGDAHYFRKDQPDVDPHLATFGDVHIEKGLPKGDGTTSGGNLDVDNAAKSPNFIEGLLGGTGWAIWKDAISGLTTAEVDILNVRMKAVFAELEVKKYTYSGGNIIYSDAGNKLLLVLPMDANGQVITDGSSAVAYRCCWLANDGEFDVKNDWAVGDQARCQTNNFTDGTHQNASNRYYWRKVLAKGEKWTYEGRDYNFVDLAASVSGTYKSVLFTKGCQFGIENDVPAYGDSIVQMGHQGDNVQRQNLIILVVNGDDAPAIKKYQGVNDYTLDGKLIQGDYYDPITHKFKTVTYGDMYVGDKVNNPWETLPGSSYMRYDSTNNQLDISAKMKVLPNSEIAPSVIEKSVQVGATNLLLNTGFRGQHNSRELNASTETSEGLEMWSPSLEGWSATNAEVIEDTDSASGKACVISNGTLSQNLLKPMLANADYFFTFKGKGDSITIHYGGQTETISLTGDYFVHHVALTPNANLDAISFTGTATICELFLEKGTVYSTTWSPSPYDKDEALDKFNAIKYLTDAISQASTTILGGLILSNIIQVGNYKDGVMQKVTAGMSGVYNEDNDVAFWGGGTFEQAMKTVAKFKRNPNYKPTDEEWRQMANFVVTHGGNAIFKGNIFADNGYFKGELRAASGTFDGYVKENFIKIEESDAELHTDGSAPYNRYYTINTNVNLEVKQGQTGMVVIPEDNVKLPSDISYIGTHIRLYNAGWGVYGSQIAGEFPTIISDYDILGVSFAMTSGGMLAFPDRITFGGGLVELIGVKGDNNGISICQWVVTNIQCRYFVPQKTQGELGRTLTCGDAIITFGDNKILIKAYDDINQQNESAFVELSYGIAQGRTIIGYEVGTTAARIEIASNGEIIATNGVDTPTVIVPARNS